MKVKCVMIIWSSDMQFLFLYKVLSARLMSSCLIIIKSTAKIKLRFLRNDYTCATARKFKRNQNQNQIGLFFPGEMQLELT